VTIGRPAAPALAELVKGGDALSRFTALAALSTMGSEAADAAAALLEAAEGAEPAMRAAILKAVGNIRGP